MGDLVLWQVCYTSEHWAMILVAVVAGSLFCLVFPLSMVFMLYRQPASVISSPAFFTRFGFLIDGYRLGTSWWESVVMLRKLLVLIIAAVVVDPYLQVRALSSRPCACAHSLLATSRQLRLCLSSTFRCYYTCDSSHIIAESSTIWRRVP